jgi:hypothetical protein
MVHRTFSLSNIVELFLERRLSRGAPHIPSRSNDEV